jgi:GNAT superfamily N-acetyltransferase
MSIHIRPDIASNSDLTDKAVFDPRIQGVGRIIKQKIYDDYDEATVTKSGYSIKIVRDFEDMAKIIAIRASACFSDPEHLYAKHFDGNDFSATQLLGFIGPEPVATIRIRYFADFARIERLTVRPTHRRSRVAFKMVQAAFAFCRDKNYRRLSGVAREEMVPFWSLLGGEVTASRDPIFIYGLPHYEMHVEFPPDPSAITPETDTMVLLRPEGRWHEAGYHETKNATAPVAVTRQPQTLRRSRRPGDLAERLSGKREGGPAGPAKAPPRAVRDDTAGKGGH